MGKDDKQVTAFETKMIHGPAQTTAWDFTKPLIPPISASTTYRLESVDRGSQGFQQFGSDQFHKDPIWIYDRLDEPNTSMLERQLATAENAETAVTFSTGMGAIASCLLSLLNSGQEILTHRTIYGCTHSLIKNWLPKFGISCAFDDLTLFTEKMINQATKVVYFETLANPTLEVIDIPKIVSIVGKINAGREDENKIQVVVDNTFSTPMGCNPISHGADFVIQSLTKNISGFGTEMGGAVMTEKKHELLLKLARKDFGAVLHPRAAWDINVHGLPTLSLRYKKQQETAFKIAQFLETKAEVEKVVYPGFEGFEYAEVARRVLVNHHQTFSPGYMLTFTLKNPEVSTKLFVDHIAKHSYAITLAVSLGLVKTLIELPNYMTHSAVDEDTNHEGGVSPYLIRMSIGLESPEDLKRDLENAFKKAVV